MASYKEFERQAQQRARFLMLVRGGLLALILVLLFCISYLTIRMAHGEGLFTATAAVMPAPNSGATSTTVTPGASDDPLLHQSWNQPEPVAPTLPQDITTPDARMMALPANGKVNREYFANTLFIGDSLTQGLELYEEGLKNAANFCAYKGATAKSIIDNASCKTLTRGDVLPQEDILSHQDASAVYFVMGANALVYQTDEAFLKWYGDFMDWLREHFPTTDIYIQSLTPVTPERTAQQGGLEKNRIMQLNNQIAQMAKDRDMYYLDLWEVLADEEGNLIADLSSDGLHLKPQGYTMWVDYLATHTVYSPKNVPYLLEPYNQ